MDSEENNFKVTPGNSHCVNSQQVTTLSSSTSSIGKASQGITTMSNQSDSYSINDTTATNSTISSLAGGGNTIYKIIFRNKTFSSNGKNELDSIKKILNNKIYKKDYLIEIFNNNKKSIYILRANYKNKFKKIY